MMDFWLCGWCHRLEAGKGECGGQEEVVGQVWGEERMREMLRLKKLEYSVDNERMIQQVGEENVEVCEESMA